MDHLPGLVQVQQGGSEAVDEPVAGGEYPVVEQEPTFWGLDGNRTSADLGALPTAPDAHDEAVLAPVDQVGAAAEVDVTKGGVSVVAWAAEHDVHIADLAWE